MTMPCNNFCRMEIFRRSCVGEANCPVSKKNARLTPHLGTRTFDDAAFFFLFLNLPFALIRV